ncbi:hypothetical protein PP631_gp042 [Streptomyces phage KimJongPhill]|uniref:Uncharacterized protein n=1 Tax=Streptomyces phage KimJongPhill TaxID=2848886 RepID=A0A8F2E6D7_9CAUD|nr:hypothetical protein PP631_gp042 [Streptomyces phage KimJongPhill]QWT29823.1 hypothetical protein SEA_KIMJONGPHILL_42 [Streptomyces phage KimJongPhill]
MRIKISDGVREVEVEAASDEKCGHDLEEVAKRMYELVAAKGGPAPIGFTSATTSDHERSWEQE